MPRTTLRNARSLTRGRAPSGSRRVGGWIALAMALVPIAPEMLSGCGSSTTAQTETTADAAATASDAGILYGMVVTGGGGAATPGPTSGSNPFGPPPPGTDDSGSDDRGSSSGATDGAVTAPDSAANDEADSSTGIAEGGTVDTGIPDSGKDSGSLVVPPDASTGNTCVNYVAPLCGTAACDLRSNTCCVTVSPTLQLTGRCVAGANSSCKQTEQTAHCQQACECGGGQSCCGIASTITGSVQSVCQSVASGAFCQPHTTDPNPAQAAEQFCKTDGECKNGANCVAQTCVFGAVFSICGLQSQAPFYCH